MRKKKKTVLIVAVVCVSVVLLGISAFYVSELLTLGASSNDRDNSDPKVQQEMLKTTLEWCGLAPVPDSKINLNIKTEGSAFTRCFRCNFDLPKDDLESWVSKSPGLQDAVITGGDSVKEYTIIPDGAAYAEATIDFDKGHVTLYTYWS